MKNLILSLIFLMLQACVPTSIRGHIKNSEETFTGKLSGDLKNGGSLKIESSKGVVCDGYFNYSIYQKGFGFFQCTDGRFGPFEFDSSGSSWVGYGHLGNEEFSFVLEN